MGGAVVDAQVQRSRYESGKSFSMTNQSGFNWASLPHPTSARTFGRYAQAVRQSFDTAPSAAPAQ